MSTLKLRQDEGTPFDQIVAAGPEVLRLMELARAANREHEACFSAAMTMLYHGIAAGEALEEAKALVPRGKWLRWMRDNVTFGDTTAYSYMLVARHKEHLLACEDVTTIQTALIRLRGEKLTTQSRIDDERIALIRETAERLGINGAARELGESYGTVQRYASGVDKTRKVKPPTSGTRVRITDRHVERAADWLVERFGAGSFSSDARVDAAALLDEVFETA